MQWLRLNKKYAKIINNYDFEYACNEILEYFVNHKEIEDTYDLLKTKYNLPKPIIKHNIDPYGLKYINNVTSKIKSEEDLLIFDKIKYDVVNSLTYVNYHNGVVASSGDTNMIITYRTFNNTTIKNILKIIKSFDFGKMKYIINSKKKSENEDYYKVNFMVKHDDLDGYVEIVFESDDCSCAGHHIKLNIEHKN